MANNTAVYGGALYLNTSIINIVPDDNHLILDYNVANKGGAIYVLDKNCEEVPNNFQCFFNDNYPPRKHFFFTNNSASEGPVLYGGLLDRCLDSFVLGIDRMKKYFRVRTKSIGHHIGSS